MAPDRTRRALLATLAGLGAAGCSTGPGSDPTTDRTSADGDDASSSGALTATPEPGTDRPATDSTARSPTDPSSTDTPPTAVRRDPAVPDSVSTAWPIPGADQGRTNYAAGATGPTEPVGELWSVDTGESLSVPVVADGTVYVSGDRGEVRAYDARTGERRWEQSVGITAGRPRVRGGRVYVEGYEEVLALDLADGAELWRLSTGDLVGFLAAGHGLYLAERADDALVRRSLADGSERWRVAVDGDAPVGRFVASDDALFFRHPRTSGPWSVAVDDGRREFSDPDSQPTPLPHDSPVPQCYRDGRLYCALNIFGRLAAYETPVPPFETAWDARHPAEGRGYQLAAGPDSLYVVTGGEGPTLRALSLADGSERWAAPLETPGGRPVVAEETVLVPGERSLVCVDPADGTERWRLSADGIGGAVVVADDLVFTSGDGRLRAFRSVDS